MLTLLLILGGAYLFGKAKGQQATPQAASVNYNFGGGTRLVTERGSNWSRYLGPPTFPVNATGSVSPILAGVQTGGPTVRNPGVAASSPSAPGQAGGGAGSGSGGGGTGGAGGGGGRIFTF